MFINQPVQYQLWWYAGLLLLPEQKTDGQVSGSAGQLRQVLLRAFNKNQICILSEVEKNSAGTITSLLNRIYSEKRIPVSTLKLNARILKELGLVEFGNSECARLTELGEFLAKIIGGDKNGEA